MDTAPAPRLDAGVLRRSKGVDAPRLTAELLLASALSCDRVRLYLDFDRPLGEPELARYRELVRRRAAGEPTAYLVGRREFFGRPFAVDARVLVPRPETELLVEAALAALPEGGRALDLCTGSGCVAVSLALGRKGARVVATDVSEDALAVARENAAALGAVVELATGDLWAAVHGRERFDVIASNPPYIPTKELAGLSREVRREPCIALDGGDDGLAILRRGSWRARARGSGRAGRCASRCTSRTSRRCRRSAGRRGSPARRRGGTSPGCPGSRSR